MQEVYHETVQGVYHETVQGVYHETVQGVYHGVHAVHAQTLQGSPNCVPFTLVHKVSIVLAVLAGKPP